MYDSAFYIATLLLPLGGWVMPATATACCCLLLPDRVCYCLSDCRAVDECLRGLMMDLGSAHLLHTCRAPTGIPTSHWWAHGQQQLQEQQQL